MVNKAWAGAVWTLALALAGCGSVLGEDRAAPPARIDVSAAAPEQAAVGAALADSLAALVTDRRGRPVAGVTVTWAVTEGEGSVRPATSVTDRGGLARTAWTVGPAAGPQQVVARVERRSGPLEARFTTVARGGAAFSARWVAGADSATVGREVPDTFTLRVLDRHGNAVPGVPVTLSVTHGGYVRGLTAATDSRGELDVRWQLGGSAQEQTLTASIEGGITAKHVLLGLPGPAKGINFTERRTMVPLNFGGSHSFNAYIYDHYGNAIPATLTWISSDPSVAVARSSGVYGRTSFNIVETRGAGSATLTAVYDSARATLEVRVAPIRLQGLNAGLGTCGIEEGGRVYCWGGGIWPALSQLPAPAFASPRASVSVGGGHMCALEPDGTAACTGTNHQGETASWRTGSFLTDRQWRVIAAGGGAGAGNHTCALTPDGQVYCWGSNVYGQLGTESVRTWDIRPALARGGERFADISAGGTHTCALRSDGSVSCWGIAGPQTWSDAGPFRSVSAGANHTCAVADDGTAYCGGNNAAGKTGGASEPGCGTAPCRTFGPIAGSIRFAAVQAGGSHTCGLDSGGTAYCWGDNSVGQLGVGAATRSSSTPLPVTGGLRFQSIAVGQEHTCGVATDALVYCWGSAAQLGRLTSVNGFLPAPVAGQR